MLAAALVPAATTSVILALRADAADEAGTVQPYACAASYPAQLRAAEDAYNDFKARFITSDGAGGDLRVKITEAGNRTYSEAQGYGMLLSAYWDDKDTFDQLWAYSKRYLNDNGVMSWKIGSTGQTEDENAATDGDVDMSRGLRVADQKWGGYREDLDTLLKNMLEHEVDGDTGVLKPGDGFGGTSKNGGEDLVNLSYSAYSYFRDYAEYTGDPRWEKVAETSYDTLDKLDSVDAGAKKTGLVPQWQSAATGTPSPKGPDFNSDSGRTPWRLALDAAWTCDPRAQERLDRINAFYKSVGPANVGDGYKLDGTSLGPWKQAWYIGPGAAGAMTDDDPAYREAWITELLNVDTDSYYKAAWRTLGLLVVSGKAVKDPTSNACATTPPPASASAEPTDSTEPTASPEPTDSTGPTASPEPTGEVEPTDSAEPTASATASAEPTGATPTESMPGGATPTGASPTGASPTGATPSESVPGEEEPTEVVPSAEATASGSADASAEAPSAPTSIAPTSTCAPTAPADPSASASAGPSASAPADPSESASTDPSESAPAGPEESTSADPGEPDPADPTLPSPSGDDY